MRVVVIGGTGLIGRQLVRTLDARGHSTLAASPTTGVNTVTRIGLEAAVSGADAVVDVGDAPSFDDDAVLEHFMISGRNLATAELAAGVALHIALSVVGAERLPNSGYMRAKLAQEAVARSAAVPCTILRSTQSFELLRSVADAATDHDVVRISPALVQPIATSDIAEELANLVEQSPDVAREVAGPCPIRLVDLVGEVLCAQRDARRVEAAIDVPYYGSTLDDRTLMPGAAARLGTTTLDVWLRDVVAHADGATRH